MLLYLNKENAFFSLFIIHLKNYRSIDQRCFHCNLLHAVDLHQCDQRFESVSTINRFQFHFHHLQLFNWGKFFHVEYFSPHHHNSLLNVKFTNLFYHIQSDES